MTIDDQPVAGHGVSDPRRIDDAWHRAWNADPAGGLASAFDLHAPALHTCARSICGDDLAPDVVQDVFLRLWCSPDRFQPSRGSLRTYLLTMTRSASVDAVRSTQRRRRRDARAVGPTSSGLPEPFDDRTADRVLASEVRERVGAALDRLDAGRRQAIRCVYFDDLSFVRSAQVCALTESAIRTRVRGGLRDMRPMLEDLLPGSSTPRAVMDGDDGGRLPRDDGDLPRGADVAAPAASSRRRRSERLAAALALVAATAAAGCATGDVGSTAPDDARLTVVTTVAPITSIVANIVGDLADVVGIVPEGTNSHTFEPLPSVAEQLSEADVVYLNGLVLEEPTRRLAEENVPDGTDIIELGSISISADQYLYDFSFPRSGGKPNPHLWTDPTFALRYAEIVRDDLSARDPENASAYQENFAAFEAIVDEFDVAMRTAFDTVAERKLVTYHDAYAYFARTYDWEVIGAIQISDFEDPTPGEVAELIDQVRESGVPAIFGSEVFPSPVLAQIGREAGVEYIDVLRDDDLPGAPGDVEHSWLGLMRFNFVTMTEALGGDASALRDFEIRNAAPDTAEYPQ